MIYTQWGAPTKAAKVRARSCLKSLIQHKLGYNAITSQYTEKKLRDRALTYSIYCQWM